MSSSEMFNQVCCICLGNKELFNWNKEIFDFCGLTYKDCYYKYVQLDENNSHFNPSRLCEICGNELKNAHFLFEKALESFYILRNCINSKNLFTDYSDVEICGTPASGIQSENYHSEHLDTSGNDSYTNELTNDSENISDTNNNLGDYEKVILNTIEVTEASRNKDWHKFKSSSEVVLEREFCEISDENDNNSITSNINDCDEKLPKLSVSENSDEASNFQTSDQKTIEEYEPADHTSVKAPKKYMFMCQYCSIEINGIAQLRRHESTHMENRERTHPCTKCGVKFYTRCALSSHLETHEENRQKKHKCEFCDKAFYNKGALNVHRRIHLGLMTKCQFCPKEFFRQVDLDRHLPSHAAARLQNSEINVKVKKYKVQCKYCDQTVLTTRWKEHKNAHLNQPQAKCKICDRDFFSRHSCAVHLRKSHRIRGKGIEEHIHYYYVDCDGRISHLRIKQQENLEILVE